MPMHDFYCENCKAQFEMLVRTGTVPHCPACNSHGVQKLVSAIAPAAKSGKIIAAARAQATREGHTSNY